MLNAISWQQYVAALIILGTAWYAYVGLRFYQSEIARIFKIKPAVNAVTPPVAHQSGDVMGAIKPETGTDLVNPEQLIFGVTEPDDISDQTVPKGPVDDLIAEAQMLVEAYTETDNKPEFLSLLKLLIDKYELFRDEISLPAVIASLKTFAANRLPFRLKDAEWPLTF